MALWVKICGITSVADALVAARAGADALGLNLIASSKRAVGRELFGDVRAAVGRDVELVAVVANLDARELRELLETGLVDRLQLHGDEIPELVAALAPRAYKAVRIGGSEDVSQARAYGGDRLLVDAKTPKALGGSGQRFDWELVRELARARPLVVAGGLTPDNVADAIGALEPFGVDVASGVECEDPRQKDPEKVALFVRRAREARGGAR